MIAFSHLLSPKDIYVWTKAFAKEFFLDKLNVLRKIHEGVRMFKVLRVTALVTHWTLEGQSLGLWQRACDNSLLTRQMENCIYVFQIQQ